MDWNTYYDKFYDWAESTRVSRISSLSSFGDPDEIVEIACDLPDKTSASRLIKKAIKYGTQFDFDQMNELILYCNDDTIHQLVVTSSHSFTKDELEELDGYVDDNTLETIANHHGFTLRDDDNDEEVIVSFHFAPHNDKPTKHVQTIKKSQSQQETKSPGFWKTFFHILFLLSDIITKTIDKLLYHFFFSHSLYDILTKLNKKKYIRHKRY